MLRLPRARRGSAPNRLPRFRSRGVGGVRIQTVILIPV